MAVNIGPRIGIEGEAEYRKSIQNIIQQQKTLKAEMQATASAWDKSTSAEKKAQQTKETLTKQVEAQEKRVKELSKMLKESADKYGENDTRTLKWKEALANATTELNKMEAELKDIPSSLDIMGKKMEENGEKLQKVGESIEGAGRKLAPFSAAAAGGLTYAVKTAADFEAQMDKVQAISGASAEQMEALSASAREWGSNTKFSATEAGQGFEYMAMAGWKTEEMLAGIGPILNLATAAGEDLGVTSDIVTDALTAFGLSAQDAGHFADIMAAASSNANTNVTMLGESFKYAAPVAGAMGYSAEDVAIALGLMANSGIKASQAGTSLRNVFQRMAKPTKESAAAMERLGLSLTDEEGNMLSFMEIMEQLRDSMAGINMPTEEFQQRLEELDQQLADKTITQKEYNKTLDEYLQQTYGAEGAEKARAAAMLGGSRAMAGLLAIANASEADFAKLSAAVTNSSNEMAMLKDGSVIPLTEALASGQEVIATYSGSADAMAAVMKDNLNGQMTELKSAIDELAISIGNILMPSLLGMVDKLKEGVAVLNSLDPEVQKTIATVGVIVAALAPVLIIVGKVITAVGTIAKAVAKLIPLIKGAGAVIAGINPVVLAVAAGIAALITIGVELYKNWDYIKEKAKEFAENVSAKWKLTCDILKGNIEKLKTDAINAWETIKTRTITAVESIKAKVTTAWEAIKSKLSAVMESIKTKVLLVWENLKTGIGNKIENIKTAVSQKFESIKEKIRTIMDGAIDIVRNAVDRLKGLFDFTWELPRIKLPHFSVSGEFSLVPPSAPHIDVDWYSKAMRDGVILNKPTIFGAQNGRLMGGGEAGPEVVVGASSLFDMIRGAVATTNNYGGNNVYVYGAPGQDVKELAREIADIINADISAEGAAFA